MALATNTRTGKTVIVPDHYIGHEVLGKDLVAFGGEVQAASIKQDAPSKEKKKYTKYVPNAVDADGDGLVQDGTEWERPFGTEIEEQTAPDNIEENEE